MHYMFHLDSLLNQVQTIHKVFQIKSSTQAFVYVYIYVILDTKKTMLSSNYFNKFFSTHTYV